MNRKTLYDALGVSPNASPAFIEVAWRHLQAELEPLMEQGQADAKQRLASARIAYEILADATKRGAYDERLRDEAAEGGVTAAPAAPATAPGRTWAIMAGALVLMAVLFYYQYQASQARWKSQVAAQVAENDRLKREVESLNGQLASLTTHVSSLKANMDDSQNRAFERDVAAVRRDIETQRQREAQQALQRENEERRRQQQNQERLAQQETRNVQSERRYWACMNEALNRLSSDQANAQCARLR